MAGGRQASRRRLSVRVPLDVGLLWASFIAAFLIRFTGHLPPFNFHPFLRTLPWLTIGWIGLADLFGLYEAPSWDETVQGVALTAILGIVLAMAISFLVRGFGFPRTVLVGGAIIDAGAELVVLAALRRRDRRHARPLRMAVVADSAQRQRLVEAVAHGREGMPYEIVGAIEPEGIDPEAALPRLRQWLARGEVDTVVLGSQVPSGLREAMALEAIDGGADVHLLPGPYEIMLAHAQVERLDDTVVLSLAARGPARDYQRVKRLMDFVLGGGLLLALSPVIGAVAALVRVRDGAPVIFRQPRIGRDGRIFSIVKFRTMIRDAERMTGPVLATLDDPRLTRLGRWLRMYRLDELPQLWNVVRGDMSLVGPRPERPELHAEIAASLPYFRHRLHITPGLTGLAQINGRYDTAPAEKLKHDLIYYGAYSPLLDLKILLRTLRVVLSGRRAINAEASAVLAPARGNGSRQPGASR